MVGIGPGGPEHRTRRAETVIRDAEVVVGYTPYLHSIGDLTHGKELISSGMRKEAERVHAAVMKANAGFKTVLVSSGDAGIYGMAGLAYEMIEAEGLDVAVDVVPGVTASSAAGAALGAPLMLDYATVSLSDLLVAWETILHRLEAAAQGGFVTALYNPRSKKRVHQLEDAVAIFKKYRKGTTPVGIVTAAGTTEEQVVLTDLDNLLTQEVGMRSLVIIANDNARIIDGKLITPRGYQL